MGHLHGASLARTPGPNGGERDGGVKFLLTVVIFFIGVVLW